MLCKKWTDTCLDNNKLFNNGCDSSEKRTKKTIIFSDIPAVKDYLTLKIEIKP